MYFVVEPWTVYIQVACRYERKHQTRFKRVSANDVVPKFAFVPNPHPRARVTANDRSDEACVLPVSSALMAERETI